MYRKIAIIRRNGLGDVLCALPLVKYCREKFPEAHISLFIDERAAPLIPYLEGMDRIEVIPSHWNKYWAMLKSALKARKEKFDLAISAKSSPMKLVNLFLYALGAKIRVACVKKSWDKIFINQRVEREDLTHPHQAVRCLNLLDPTFSQVPKHYFPRLKVAPLPANEKQTLFVSVTNNRIGSQLDNDKIARLLNALSLKKPFYLLINCEPKDKGKAEELEKSLQFKAEVVITSSFDHFLQTVQRADLLFVGDGGIMHLAAALDKRQLVLFGGTKVEEWAPLSDKAVCLTHEKNVNDIPEEKIFEALVELV